MRKLLIILLTIFSIAIIGFGGNYSIEFFKWLGADHLRIKDVFGVYLVWTIISGILWFLGYLLITDKT
jgi:hypothetical protein